MDNDTDLQEQALEERKTNKYIYTSNQSYEIDNKVFEKHEIPKPPMAKVSKKQIVFFRGLKFAGKFIVEHPVESLELLEF